MNEAGEDENPEVRTVLMVKRSVKLLVTVLSGLVVLLLLAASGLIVYLKNMDFNTYKPLLKQTVFEATGRKLNIDGEVELKLSLRPLLAVEGLHLSNAEGGSRANMVNVARMEVQLSLLPLLDGKLDVDSIILVAPDILLETLPSGADNWNFGELIPGQPDHAGAEQNIAGGDSLLLPQMQRILIQDARVRYLDNSAGYDIEILLKEVEMTQLPNEMRLSIRGAGEVNHQDVQFSGMIDDVSALLANHPIQLQAFQADYLGLHAAFNGSIREPLDALGMDLNLVLESSSMLTVANMVDIQLPHDFPLKLEMNIKDRAYGFHFSTMQVNMGDSELSGELGLNLMGERLAIDGILNSTAFDLSRFLDVEEEKAAQPVSSDDSEAKQGNDQRLSIDDIINLSILKMVDLKLALKVKRLKLPEYELVDLDTWINLENGVLVLNPFTLGIAEGGGVDLSSMTASDLSGHLTLNVTGTRPAIDGVLSATAFDLSRYLKAAAQPASLENAIKKRDYQRLFSENIVNLSILNMADAQLALKVKRLRLPELELSNLDSHIKLTNGKLILQPFAFGVAGGKASGSLKLVSQPSPANLSMQLHLTDIQPAAVLPIEKGEEALIEDTQVNADLYFSGAGKSVASIMAHADGAMLVKLGEGRVLSSALRLIGGDVLMNLANTLNPYSEKMNYNALQCGVIHFHIKDGVMTTRNGIAFETERMNVISSGDVNLASEKINLSISTETREGLGLNVTNMVNVVKLGGTLMEPGITVDAAKTSMVAARTVGAIATAGLSLLGETLFNRVTADSTPCETALKMVD